MIQKTVLIQNRTGIHARPAAQFVKLAGKFQSAISIANDEEKVNAKSIMKVLGLGASRGTTVVLTFEGEDEQQAAEEIVNFLSHLTE